MEIEVFFATKADACDISELEKECFSVPWTMEDIEQSLNNFTVFYVAKINGKTVGYCGMQNASGDGYITNVAVTKNARGRGVATKLLLALIGFAKENDIGFISLEVRESNVPAIALYKKLGFIEVGTRKNFYTAPRENALIMTKYFKE